MVEHLGLEPSSISLQGRSADPARTPIGLPWGPDPAPRATERWRDGSDPHEYGGAWGRFRAHLSAASMRRFHQISFPGEFRIGAADGNRTHVCALATHGSAIELRTLKQ